MIAHVNRSHAAHRARLIWPNEQPRVVTQTLTFVHSYLVKLGLQHQPSLSSGGLGSPTPAAVARTFTFVHSYPVGLRIQHQPSLSPGGLASPTQNTAMSDLTKSPGCISGGFAPLQSGLNHTARGATCSTLSSWARWHPVAAHAESRVACQARN